LVAKEKKKATIPRFSFTEFWSAVSPMLLGRRRKRATANRVAKLLMK
jgi:hypothetical protein